jgi:cysteinyl-tRNA synthetase
VSTDEYDKENARDFVLWKAVKPEDEAVQAAWDTPFGRGRPGWHLECSAMALSLLKRHGFGEVLDIHAGGVDLIFPHHEDEIAQSCAYTGQAHFARYWLHGEFLSVRGTKMSKRFGNFTTPRDLRADGVDAGAFRLLVFQVHYRQKMDLSDDSLSQAREACERLGDFDRRLRERGVDRSPPGQATEPFDRWSATLESGVRDALNDDLNAPEAIAAIFGAVRDGNRMLDQGLQPLQGSHVQAWNRVMAIFDVLPGATGTFSVPVGVSGRGEVLSLSPPEDPSLHQQWATQLAEARSAARSRRDYKEADRIRDALAGAGWEVRDNKDGTAKVRRSSG